MSKPGEREKYPTEHRDWECPSTACKFTLRTLPTRWAPGHRCNPSRPSTHHYLRPIIQPKETP